MVQDKYAHIYNKVKKSLDEEHLFLRADLSLKLLSRIIGTNTVYLSKAINQGFGCSFSTIVNRYRVDYLVKEAIATDANIEELVSNYGFWSRSTLYDVFRVHTGMTPHRYLEKKKDESKKYEV